MFNLGTRLFTAFFALSCMVGMPVLASQETDAESSLDDFIHYSLVANIEFAEGHALALLRDPMSDEAFYEMVTATKDRFDRFDRAIGWALFVVELEPIASKLEERFEAGRTSVIRNADRLNESIGLLDGTTRQKLLAKDRLKQAGEYAVPALLRRLHAKGDAKTSRSIREMLTGIGRDAVLPLTVALPHLDDATQALVARVLGEIGYTHASPALIALANDTQNADIVRSSARQALTRIGIVGNSNLSSALTVVAMQFYDRQVSVLPEPVGGVNIFWTWDSLQQLVALDVPDIVFDDVMAMYYASMALEADQTNAKAMSVFVGANLRRDRELAGQSDLVYGNLAHSPAFYATVFGPEIAQQILATALEDHDTSLSLDAIAALSRTAGAESILANNEQPLISAMFYPDRRVQYESALTLASTLPTNEFAGSYRVVPLLASAVRSGGDMFAIVIGDDVEANREMTMFLSDNGWKIVGQSNTARGAVVAAGVVPGIDLAVVLARSADHGEVVADELDYIAETTVTPTFVLADGSAVQILADAIGARDMIEIANKDISVSAKLAVIEDLLATASGGRLSIDESNDFAFRALAVLRDIALADTVLQVDDATGTLIDALGTANYESQAIIAQTLAMINDPVAQRALIGAGIKSGDIDQRVMLLDEAAGSVRRWGNLAQDWQIEEVIDLAEKASGFLADAAARLNGALDHPNTSVMMFMP